MDGVAFGGGLLYGPGDVIQLLRKPAILRGQRPFLLRVAPADVSAYGRLTVRVDAYVHSGAHQRFSKISDEKFGPSISHRRYWNKRGCNKPHAHFKILREGHRQAPQSIRCVQESTRAASRRAAKSASEILMALD